MRRLDSGRMALCSCVAAAVLAVGLLCREIAARRRSRVSPRRTSRRVVHRKGARQVRVWDFSRCLFSVGVSAAMLAFLSATQAATQDVPDWMKLREGRSAYFGVGFAGPVPACPTFDRYVTWLRSVKARKAEPCPTTLGGQRVTVLNWKMYSLGPGLVAPIVHVQLARGAESAWTGLVSPVVPPGAVVATTGNLCSAEAARLHTKISSSAAWLSACRAVVVRQLISSSKNTLIVRLLRSGTTARIDAGEATLPSPLYPNGFARYPVSDFADAH